MLYSKIYLKRENISRNKLAEVANMPLGTFCRIFKETTGMSPIDYLIRLRIDNATKLITDNNKIRITDVALRSGFENSAYFSKKFKEIIGVPPMAYMKNQRIITD